MGYRLERLLLLGLLLNAKPSDRDIVLNDPVNSFDPLGLWGVDIGGTLIGADFSATIYDSNKSWFPSSETDIGVSTTAFGGGIKFTFDDPCESSNNNDSDLMVSWGLSKYLGISYSPDFSRKSINLGLGLGLPVSFSSSVENFTKVLVKGLKKYLTQNKWDI